MKKIALALLLVGCGYEVAPPAPFTATEQDADAALAKSRGCLTCHAMQDGIDELDMHTATMKVKLGCIDCHGGDPTATEKALAHVQPRFPEEWVSAANPKMSYTLLNREDPAFIRFVNPTDLRVVNESCGSCHAKEVGEVRKSMMTTSALFWAAGTYNNGTLPLKKAAFGESYSRDGVAQIIQAVPPLTDEERAKGALDAVGPLPRWNVAQPGNVLRAFERGGKIPRINPSEVGNPLPFEEGGKPDMKLGDRGLGTQLRFDPVVLNVHKTRLNDPHLSFLGSNDHAGDYRSSGCAACHVVYANDREPRHSGPYAKYGHRGEYHGTDPSIPKGERGHPISHRFTNAIPSSQCMTCHHHQPNAFVNSYFGYTMWDYEMDGDPFWPKTQKEPKLDPRKHELESNPEGAVTRGNWADPDFLDGVWDLNKDAKRTQFADYHGHGWIFRAVYKKDRKGNLLDEAGAIVDDVRKAVHLMDAHAEAGMHCIDCHTKQDNHGNGKLYGEYANAVEIDCTDCHGTVRTRFGGEDGAEQRTSGPAAGGANLLETETPWGEPRFEWHGPDDPPLQRSMVDPEKSWEIPQVQDVIDPAKPQYNEMARLAKTVRKDGVTWGDVAPDADLAHGNNNIECHACHTSWVTSCFGCHLPMRANERRSMKHYEGDTSRNWTTYNPQVVRDEVYMLGRQGTVKGGKIAAVRSSSAVMISSQNANREWIYQQQMPWSAPGYSSQAFNPHFAHTVRGAGETKMCSDCHVSAAGDNNAWMAQLFLHGTNYVNFLGRYAYVGTGEDGFEAVIVGELEEPQAVIGSNLHRLAYPKWHQDHLDRAREAPGSYHHDGDEILDLQLRGEYLYTANGSGGFEVFDVANVYNKGFSERLVTSPVSPAGQDTHVATSYATSVALPTNMPVHYRNDLLPPQFWRENQETPMHELYKYAFVTDRDEGVILVDVMPLADGDPRNNFLERALTWNANGLIAGARHIELAGTLGFISCDAGLVVASFDRPLEPRVLATVPLNKPVATAVQFRYAFALDADGMHTIDITFPERPAVKAFVPLYGAHNLTLARTYAYVAAGARGLALIDIEKPEAPGEPTFVPGLLDTRDVTLAMSYTSSFAYVADGRFGLKVFQMTSPESVPGWLGFSPEPKPEMIAWTKTGGPALAISRAIQRDRAVDETGNQVSVFGRIGSRPLSIEEQRRMYLRDETVWTVDDKLPPEPRPFNR